MTVAPEPLALPDSAWEDWVATRCDGRLGETRRLVDVLRAGGQSVITTTELAHVPGAEDAGVEKVAIAEGRVLQGADGGEERLAG